MKITNLKLNFRRLLTPLDVHLIKYFVFHHLKAVSASANTIHQWHLDNGEEWNGFGYNEYIRKDGSVEIGRGMNVGAHCTGYNSVSYGFGLEGDFTQEHPTQEQINSLVARTKYIQSLLPNQIENKNHYDLGNSSCPVIDLVKLVKENIDYEEKSIFDRYEDLEKENKKNKNIIDNCGININNLIKKIGRLKEENGILKKVNEGSGKVIDKLIEEIKEYEKEETRLVKIVKKTRAYIKILYDSRKK